MIITDRLLKVFSRKGHSVIKLCPVEIKTLTTLLANVSDTKQYECTICKTFFSTKGNLARHKNSDHNGFTYQCNICPNVFNDQSNLKSHIKSVHCPAASVTHFTCQICQKILKYKKNLNRHLKIHNVSEKKIQMLSL